jgi:hypothetical protein
VFAASIGGCITFNTTVDGDCSSHCAGYLWDPAFVTYTIYIFYLGPFSWANVADGGSRASVAEVSGVCAMCCRWFYGKCWREDQRKPMMTS